MEPPARGAKGYQQLQGIRERCTPRRKEDQAVYACALFQEDATVDRSAGQHASNALGRQEARRRCRGQEFLCRAVAVGRRKLVSRLSCCYADKETQERPSRQVFVSTGSVFSRSRGVVVCRGCAPPRALSAWKKFAEMPTALETGFQDEIGLLEDVCGCAG